MKELDPGFHKPFFVIDHDNGEYYYITKTNLRCFREREKYIADIVKDPNDSLYQRLYKEYFDSFQEEIEFDPNFFPKSVIDKFPYITLRNEESWVEYIKWENKLLKPILISYRPPRPIIEIYRNINQSD